VGERSGVVASFRRGGMVLVPSVNRGRGPAFPCGKPPSEACCDGPAGKPRVASESDASSRH
jgi:hypothetical protein